MKEDIKEKNVFTDISEPEALALYYMQGRDFEKDDSLFAVFDFGGGTTDISIGRLKYKDNVKIISILLSIGLEELGGDILTFELAKDIYEKVRESDDSEYIFPKNYEEIFKISLVEKEKLYNFMNFMNEAEKIKTNEGDLLLSLENNKSIQLNFPIFYSKLNGDQGIRSNIEFTFEDFNRIVKSKVLAGFEKLKGIFQHLKDFEIIEANRSIDLLILGGNSSRLSLVQKCAQEVLVLSEEKILFEPSTAKTAVAEGAVIYGKLRRDPSPDIYFDNLRYLKFPLCYEKNHSLQFLFPAGSRDGHRSYIELSYLKGMKNRNPIIILYWNRDPTDLEYKGNINLDVAVEIDPEAFIEELIRLGKERVSLCLELVEEGLKISGLNLEELIEFKW